MPDAGPQPSDCVNEPKLREFIAASAEYGVASAWFINQHGPRVSQGVTEKIATNLQSAYIKKTVASTALNADGCFECVRAKECLGITQTDQSQAA